MSRIFSILLAAAFIVAASSGCGRREVAPAPVRGAVLVTVEKGGCPADASATGLFVWPVSADVLPSAATALTGVPPSRHGLRVDGVGALDPATPTLATRFCAEGYDCAAFLSDIALAPVHGLTNGFSVYSATVSPTNRATGFRRSAAEVCAEANAWIDARHGEGRPVFLWLHLPEFDAEPVGEVLGRFAKDTPVVALSFEADAAGLEAPEKAPGFVRNVRAEAAASECSVADAGYLFGFADGPSPRHWESLASWYAFRLPPLERKDADCAVSVLDGLAAAPVGVPLGHQGEMAVLRSRGHLGEGLVPPYTNGVALATFDEAGEARVARWRAALAAPATNHVEALRTLVESDPGVPLFAQELGNALLARKDFTEACNAFAAASRDGWNMVLALRLQARCHAAIGNVPAAIDCAESAFLVNEGDPLPRRELAELLLRTGAALSGAGQVSEARECLDRALLLAPGSPAARLELARNELRAGDTNGAVERLRFLLRDRPSDKAAQALLRSLGK